MVIFFNDTISFVPTFSNPFHHSMSSTTIPTENTTGQNDPNIVTEYFNLQDWVESPEERGRGVGWLEEDNNIGNLSKDYTLQSESSSGYMSGLPNFATISKDADESIHSEKIGTSRSKMPVMPVTYLNSGPSTPNDAGKHGTIEVSTSRSNHSEESLHDPMLYQTIAEPSASSSHESEDQQASFGEMASLKKDCEVESPDKMIPPTSISEKGSKYQPRKEVQADSQNTNTSKHVNQKQISHRTDDLDTLLMILHRQGVYEVKVSNGKLASYLSNLFKEIHRKFMKPVTGHISHDLEGIKSVERATKRAQFTFLVKFFGGLNVIYHLNRGRVLKGELMRQGCVFINSFLKQWVSISLEEIKRLGSMKNIFDGGFPQTPKQMFGYMMGLKDESDLSYGSVISLLDMFYRWHTSQERSLVFLYDAQIFRKKCWDLYEKRDDITDHNHDSKDLPLPNDIQQQSPEENTITRISVEDNHPSIQADKSQRKVHNRYTIKRGREILNLCSIILKGQLTTFFAGLNVNLVNIAKTLPPKTIQDLGVIYKTQSRFRRSSKNKNVNPTVEDISNHLIHFAQVYVTPMFLELVKLHNNENKHCSTLDSSLEDGWKYLQQYFSTWIYGLLFDNKEVQASYQRTPIWSNTRVVMYHLLSLTPGKQPPASGLVKYIFLQWYNHNR